MPDKWPSSALLELLEIDVPIVQAPMAGAQASELAAAVSAAGGLGSLPCAMLSIDAAREEVAKIRAATNRAFQLNFFCHASPGQEPSRQKRWSERLAPYFAELGVEPPTSFASARKPFDEAFCTGGRGGAAEGRQLPFRPAARGALRAREADGSENPELGDDRR